MHNFKKKKKKFNLKMWKVFIHGQNHTKHKMGPSLSLDPFYFCWKGGEKLLKVETLVVLNPNF